MRDFFNNYLHIGKMMKEKRQYKANMARIKALPEDYQYVFKKIQNHMWQFVSGAGYDMLHMQYELIDLFEEGAANGRSVLEVTGEDVASFVDELLKNTKTYTADWQQKLNRDIQNKFGKK